MPERILIMGIMYIRHITISKEWMTSLKSFLTLTLTLTLIMMKTLIIPQEMSKEKTLTVEMTDMS